MDYLLWILITVEEIKAHSFQNGSNILARTKSFGTHNRQTLVYSCQYFFFPLHHTYGTYIPLWHKKNHNPCSINFFFHIQCKHIKTCESIHRKCLQFLLPKLGYPTTLPRPIAFGSKVSGSIGLVCFNAEILKHNIQYITNRIFFGNSGQRQSNGCSSMDHFFKSHEKDGSTTNIQINGSILLVQAQYRRRHLLLGMSIPLRKWS